MENKSQEDDIYKRISQGDNGANIEVNSRNEEVANELRGRIAATQANEGKGERPEGNMTDLK